MFLLSRLGTYNRQPRPSRRGYAGTFLERLVLTSSGVYLKLCTRLRLQAPRWR